MPYYGKNVVYKYRTVKGFPVYALFLKDCKANKVPLPNAFVARYKACSKLWKATMKGEVKRKHYLRASKIVFKQRISLGRRFKGVPPYFPRPFATFIAASSKGKKGTPDLKKIAAEYKALKAKK